MLPLPLPLLLLLSSPLVPLQRTFIRSDRSTKIAAKLLKRQSASGKEGNQRDTTKRNTRTRSIPRKNIVTNIRRQHLPQRSARYSLAT